MLTSAPLTKPHNQVIALFGNSGTGKSTLLNTLHGIPIAATDPVMGCTRTPQASMIDRMNYPNIYVMDMPGLSEDPERHDEYADLYHQHISYVNLVLWTIKADDRSYASNLEVFQRLFSDYTHIPVVFVITQSDKIGDPEDWDSLNMSPRSVQRQLLEDKKIDIYQRYARPAEDIVPIAIRKHGKTYGIDLLWSRILTHLFPLTSESSSGRIIFTKNEYL